MNIRLNSKNLTALCGALAFIVASGVASAGPVGLAAPEAPYANLSAMGVHWRHHHHHHYRHHHHHHHHHHHRGR